MWTLVLCLGIEPRPPELGAWSLSHWTTREIPEDLTLGEKWTTYQASQVALVVKNSSANGGDTRDSGRSPGGGHSNPLQYSCQGNPRDRGIWWAMVHRVAKSPT